MRRARTMMLTGTVLLLTAALACATQADVALPPSPTEQPDSPQARQVVNAYNSLGIDLYQQIAQDDQANVFLSPYSIYTALAMVSEGARGQTEQQMHALLGVPPRPEGIADYSLYIHRFIVAGLIERFNAERDTYILTTANRIFGDQQTHFHDAFLDTLDSRYGAELGQLDFRADPEGARQHINDWVAQQTDDRIEDLMPAGSIDELTRLVLANAIYFKADWAHPFNEQSTRDDAFHLADGSTVEVPMMSQSQIQMRFHRDDERTLIELPYQGGDLSMLITVPAEHDGLPVLEDTLSAQTLEQWDESLERAHVNLWMPRFEFQGEYTLNRHLQSLGMTDAFVPRTADFTGITDDEELYISIVQHKSFIAVDEDGTEAAAATGIGVRTTMMPAEVHDVRIDRPFFFTIRENATGTVLFMGRVNDPS